MNYYVVTYTGPFGFIKPWAAVRDGETFSQQFLTPSIVAGMERKLFPELLKEAYGHYAIVGHRLSYSQMSAQQEQVQPRGWNFRKKRKMWERPRAILVRNVLLNPILHVAFNNHEFAERAATQHLCLCRNEDVVYPITTPMEVTKEEFDSDENLFSGFELVFEQTDPRSFLVGYNRYNDATPMYGWLRTVGEPVNLQGA